MDEEKKKKLYVIVSIVAAVALVGALIYLLFIKKPAPTAEQPAGQFPVSEEAEGVIGKEKPFIKRKITLVVDRLLAGPVITPQNTIRYFSKEDGKFYETDFNGQNTRSPFNLTYQNLVDAEWNNQGNVALITTTDATNFDKKWKILDIAGPQPLNIEVNEKEGAGIIAVALAQYDPGKYFFQTTTPLLNTGKVILADYTTENYDMTEVMQSGRTTLRLSQPKQNILSFYHPPSGVALSSFYFYDMTTKEIQKSANDVFGFSALWNPQGEYYAFSSTDENGLGLRLQLSNYDGKIINLRAETSPATTVPEKCAFTASGSRLYCAVYVGNIADDYIMPDDYYKDKVVVDESLYMFQVPSGRDVRVGDFAEEDPETKNLKKYHANKLVVDPAEKFIFFINKEDGFLYKMEF